MGMITMATTTKTIAMMAITTKHSIQRKKR